MTQEADRVCRCAASVALASVPSIDVVPVCREWCGLGMSAKEEVNLRVLHSTESKEWSTAQFEGSNRKLRAAKQVVRRGRFIALILDEDEAKGLEPGSRRDIERRVGEVCPDKEKSTDALQALAKM